MKKYKPVKPFRYQRKGIRLIENKFGGRAIVGDEMGLGKTITAGGWYSKFIKKGTRMVVVCPASLRWQWQDELATKFGLRSEILMGKTRPLYKTTVGGPKILIIGYDCLFNNKNKKSSWLTFLKEWNPRVVIVDEAHLIKNRQSQRSKATKKLCKGVPSVLLLTGTAITNMPAELWPLVNIVRPKLFPNFYDFAYEYCQPKLEYGRWTFKGAKNLDKLHKKLKRTCMLRRLFKNVFKDMPSKIRSVIPVELPPKEKKEYETLRDKFVRWLKLFAPTMSKSSRQANRLVQMGYLKRFVGTAKMKINTEWIDNFLEETDEKLIVFGIHKKVLRPLYEKYKQISVLVDGTVTGQERQRRIKQFQQDKKTRLFFGNIHAAGVGWNGTVASKVLFVELDWVPGNHNQAESRPQRIGQTRQVICYYLVAKGTIEEMLCGVLQKKQKVSDQLLDGAKKQRKDTINIMDLLEKKLSKRKKK